MKVSLAWLAEFVDIDAPAERLAELLDLSGTKVEAVRRPERNVKGVVVAEAVEIVDHPNSDKLTLVDVRTDEGGVTRVVCGARNFEVGDKVPFAMVGAVLPELEITERKIRGEVSHGMLCSAAELGVSKDHSGILVLPPDAELGADVIPLLGLDDTVLELEITPNRPDCMSMIGVAREVATVLGTELKVPEVGRVGEPDLSNPVRVEIEDPAGCPRYLARYISGVSIGASPTWMSTRLLSAGIRPISNVVDVTNYVLLERGQPLHAFDARQVAGNRIVVRRARAGERLTTLDGVERTLDPADLLITDPERALALAGVMGGEDSEVAADTTDVILESAYFDHRSVAFTARRHLLRSEASARFERGADPEGVASAAARATQLIVELAGGTASGAEVDVYPTPHERTRITLRPERTDRLLGAPISRDTQVDYLTRLGLDVVDSGPVLEATVPGFRPDLRREVDLIEEVGRLAGFERLPATLPSGAAGMLDAAQSFERSLRRALVGAGITEAWTSSFMSPADLERLGLTEGHPAARLVTLNNPMGEDESVLRSTLLPGLLRSVSLNVARGTRSVALFEIARVYERIDEVLPQEALVLGVAAAGVERQQGWLEPERRWGFFEVKGVIDAVLTSLRFGPPSYSSVSGPPFHPTRAASLSLGGTALGVVGELHPDVADAFSVPERTVVAEFALAGLIAALPERVKVSELPRFPSVLIDLALIVREHVQAATVETLIRQAGAPELSSIRLFDVYRGQPVPAGKKSLAYALTFQADDRSLTEDEVRTIYQRIQQRAVAELGAQPRQ